MIDKIYSFWQNTMCNGQNYSICKILLIMNKSTIYEKMLRIIDNIAQFEKSYSLWKNNTSYR